MLKHLEGYVDALTERRRIWARTSMKLIRFRRGITEVFWGRIIRGCWIFKTRWIRRMSFGAGCVLGMRVGRRLGISYARFNEGVR